LRIPQQQPACDASCPPLQMSCLGSQLISTFAKGLFRACFWSHPLMVKITAGKESGQGAGAGSARAHRWYRAAAGIAAMLDTNPNAMDTVRRDQPALTASMTIARRVPHSAFLGSLAMMQVDTEGMTECHTLAHRGEQ
jgi:hypothetical protein